MCFCLIPLIYADSEYQSRQFIVENSFYDLNM